MTELCRLGSSVVKALVRITRDPWFESRPSFTLFCHIGDPDVIGPLPTSIVSQGNSCSKHIYTGLAGGIYRRYLPPVFTGKYRHGQYSQKWRLPAFTGVYKYFINFSSNYFVESPSYLLYYTWTP